MPARKTVTAAATKAPVKSVKAAPAMSKAPAAKVSAKPAAVAKAAAGAKPAAAPTVTLKHLAAQIAEEHEMQKKVSEQVLSDVVDLMVQHLKNGDRLRIGGLGILEVKKRAARMGRNPATGEAIKIKASKKVAFRPAKELKESI